MNVRIVYVLLSPTFGMHLYTADLANRLAGAGHDVHLVSTVTLPRDCYSPQVQIHTPVTASNTGFSSQGLWAGQLRRAQQHIVQLRPDVVHFTGVHLWNPALVRWLRAAGVPVVHSLHDLDPHLGVRFGRLIRLWNRSILANADRILVHGQVYRERLLARGLAPERVVYAPLLHLFLSYTGFATLTDGDVQSEPWALFFGRLERYKGVSQLLSAGARVVSSSFPHRYHLVLAGPGPLSASGIDPAPPGVEIRNRLIADEEGIDLFRRCGLLVLPYLDATQSALIGSAYYFHKPVIVTSAGALAEYVIPGQTGWIVPPGDVDALAACLTEALSDPGRLEQMGSAGRAWYDQQRAAEWRVLLDMYGAVSERGKGFM